MDRSARLEPRFGYDGVRSGHLGLSGNNQFIDYTELSDLTGLPPKKLEEIITTPWGQRPNPASYMSEAEIKSSLAKFDEGAVRFTRQSDIDSYGTIGPSGGAFVIPMTEFDNLLRNANGKLSVVEQRLGLKIGQLTNGDIKALYIKKDEIKNLRIPTGNEAGASRKWIPGGKTQGGVSEAVIDVPEGLKYSPLEFRYE